MGFQMRQLLPTFYVTSSLARVAQTDSNLADGFYLRTLNFGRPLDNRGTRFEYGCRIS
jgi:hypothetical protein